MIRNIVVLVVVAAVVVSVVLLLKKKDERPENTGKGSSKTTEKKGRRETHIKTVKEDDTPRVTNGIEGSACISGKVHMNDDESEQPDLKSATIQLKTLAIPPVVIDSLSCDLPGDFMFSDVEDGEYLVDAVSSGDWSVVPEYARVKNGKDVSELSLYFQKRLNFKGIVQDKDSNPIERAQVFVAEDTAWTYSSILFEEAVRRDIGKLYSTDVDGRFSGYSRNDHLHLFVRKEGYAIAMDCCGSTARKGSDIVFTLADGAMITGNVVDESGFPAGQALVVADWDSAISGYPEPSDSPRCIIVETDADGRFTVDSLHAGKYNIIARSSDRACVGMTTCEVTPEKTADASTIILGKMRVIKGRVLDEEGKAIKGVEVEMRIDYESPWYVVSRAPDTLFPLEKKTDEEKGLTDGEGRFKITAISDEDLNIQAEHEDYETGNISVPKDEDKELKIILHKIEFTSVKVKVLDGLTGKPVKDAKAVIMRVLPKGVSEYDFYDDDYSSGFGRRFGGGFGRYDETKKSTDDDGIATFKIRKPGKWSFMAATREKVSDQSTINVKKDQNREIELTLRPAPSVIITVLSKETAEPVAEARIGLTPQGRADITIRVRAVRAISRNPKTIEDGTLKLTMIPAGKYEISINAFGYKTGDKSIIISEGENIFTVMLEKSATVRGKVVDIDGKPIDDANLELFRLSGSDMEDTYDGSSDEDGSFKFAISQSGKYKIRASHERHSNFESEEFEVKGKESLTDFNIVMTDGGTISGKIIDAQGQPVSDAEVSYDLQTEDDDNEDHYFSSYGDSETRTSDDGEYRIEHITPGTYTFVVSSKMHVTGIRENVVVEDGVDTSGIDFVLQEGLILSGTVTDKEGQPVENVEISLSRIWDREEGNYDPYDTWRETKSTPDGTFIAGGLADGKYMLYASKEGYLDKNEEVTAGTSDLQVVLYKGATLKGRIVSASDGKPVTSFIINKYGTGPYDTEPMGPDKYRAYRSDGGKLKKQDDGSFTIENVKPGKMNLKIFAKGYAAKKIEGIEVKEEETTDIGTITVDKGLSIEVTVTSETHGTAVEGATVMIRVKPDDKTSMYSRYSSPFPHYGRNSGFEVEPGVTDGTGTCLIDGITPGKKVLSVSHESFVDKNININVSESSERNFAVKLSEGLTFRGVVLSKATEQPVDGASVKLTQSRDYDIPYSPWGRSDSGIRTDETGRFTIENVKSARYSLTINQDDYAPFSEQIAITPETQPQTYYLMQGGSLLVRVKDKDGQPVTGCYLRIPTMGAGTNWNSKTDTNGEGLFENLPAKTTLVSAYEYHPPHRQQTKSVSIVAGETAELDFVLGGGYAVYGTVTRNGKPASGLNIFVSLREYGGYGASGGRSGIAESGEFRVEGIKTGKYLLVVYSFKGESASIIKREDIEVIDRDLEVNIDIPSGTISGIVADEDRSPIIGAEMQMIAISDKDDASSFMSMSMAEWSSLMGGGNLTDDDGRYAFEDVGKGTFRIGAKKKGYASASRTVTKREEDDLENVDLKLESSLRISGMITTEDGLSLQQAYLLVIDASGNPVAGDLLILDDEGRYEYSDIGTGEYEIIVAARGYAFARKKAHMASEEQEINFVLKKGNTLTITVTDGSGVPIEGALPMFTHKDPVMTNYLKYFHTYGGEYGVGSSSAADADGVIIVDALSKQKYEINVTRDGYTTKKLTVHMTGEDKNVEVILQDEE